jgi:hypothetical protein
MKKLLKDNGLTITLMAVFLVTIIGMALTGLEHENGQLRAHDQTELGLGAYVLSGSFISTVFENWESEFLQMSAYVMLTAILFQRGSAESADPDEPDRPGDSLADAPGKGLLRWLYAHSLGLALATLFLVSFVIHWLASARAANEEALRHGQPIQTAFEYLADPQLWFESFQNWQSEFLSTAVLVVLSIFLRFKGSPESKPVSAPHSETGA